MMGTKATDDHGSFDPDYIVTARRVAKELMPLLLDASDKVFSEAWGFPPGAFVMIVAAALHHQATAAMATAAGKPVDLRAMFTGIKAYAMMYDVMIDIGAIESAMGETQH